MKVHLLTLLIALLSLCYGNEDSVTLPLRSIPSDLRVDRLTQVDQVRLARLITNSLFEVGENLQLRGELAKKSYWNKEGNKLYVELRQATFSDGDPLSVDLVIDSLSRCIKVGKKSTVSAFQKIEGYQDFISGKTKKLKGLLKEGKRTISIKTTSFAPLMKENLSSVACSIIRSVKENSNDLLNGAMGTGPYMIIKKSDKGISLKKRFGQGPSLIEFISTDQFGNFYELKDKVDLILVDSKIGDKKNFNKHKNSRLASWHLSFNNESRPFNSFELRKAIALGLDYKLLAEEMGWNTHNLQKGLFPLGMRGFQKRSVRSRFLKEANEILEKSGYNKKKPLLFNLLLSRRKNARKSKSIWERAFRGLFVKVSIDLLDQKEAIKRSEMGDFDLVFHGKASGSHEPHILLASYLPNSPFNTPRIRNKKCAQLIERSLQEHDKEQRWNRYQQAQGCLLKTHFIIPLATLNSGYALVRKPWIITRKNQYLLNPYDVTYWKKEKR